jgi:hypothetical protein
MSPPVPLLNLSQGYVQGSDELALVLPRCGRTLRGAAAASGGHIVKMFGTRFAVAL